MKKVKYLFVISIVIFVGCKGTMNLENQPFNVKNESYGTIISGNNTTKNFERVLFPYDVCVPDRPPMIPQLPKYTNKTFKLPKGIYSAKEFKEKLSSLIGLPIVIDGTDFKKDKWTRKSIDIKQGEYSFAYLLQELISYMQEVGIPRDEKLKWKKEWASKQEEAFYANHIIVAELLPEKVVIKMYLTGIQKI